MILIIYSPGTNKTLGGAWSSTWKLAETIAEKGAVKIIVDTQTYSLIPKPSQKCTNIEVKAFPKANFNSKFGQILVWLRYVKLFNISSHIIISSPSNSSFNFIVGIKSYRFIHSEIDQFYGRKFFERFGKKNYLAASHYLYKKLIVSGISKEKCSLLVNIPEKNSSIETKKNRRVNRVITAAQFSQYRLNELWLTVANRITQSHPDWEFHWFGADKKQKTENANVFIHEFEPKISQMLGNYDIYLNLTKFETHGLSVLEAMSWGLPVITSEVGNMKNLIENNRDGVLVQNDYRNVYDAIENLIRNAELRIRVGEEAQRKYLTLRKDYNFQKQVNAIFNIS